MSPQLLEAGVRGIDYNVFKIDVYALGASLLLSPTHTYSKLVTLLL